MARQQKPKAAPPKDNSQSHGRRQPFHLEFLNQAQKMAWGAFDQHDVLFLLGPAGCGKTHLACAFAISEILSKRKKKCVLTRPIVEAGEALGFLPGTFDEKVSPYMMPMYDCIEKCVGREGPQREILDRSLEVAPIAYMRGRTFDNAVCIFDEAQNATVAQLKLFMTRFGENSKIIITGDPNQSDLRHNDQGLMHVVNRLQDLQGIGVIHFKASSIVRHPLIASILEKLEEQET
ncbi:MAG: PhoH family protein [Candidatus Obscuribacterales bacterium]|nr:PhoH family protein [Candidatus Obscuribacterales bacterium]